VLWSTGGLFIKWISLDALGVTMWRSLFAAATIAVFMGVRPSHIRFDRITWALALSYAVMLVLFVIGTKLTTAANAIFLQYTAPLYVLLFGRYITGERPSRVDAVCVAVAFGGMALFFVGDLSGRSLWGSAAAAASGVGFALFLALLRHPRCRPETRPAAMTLGNVLLVVALVPVNLGRGEWSAFSPGVGEFGALVFLGVVQIGLAYVCFGYGIARVPALEAVLIGMLEPVLNPVWVLVFLDERPGWWAVAGGAVIIAAVAARTVVSERSRRRGPGRAGPTLARAPS
jgi:drug/metabolite transporter (DMT)-like permease